MWWKDDHEWWIDKDSGEVLWPKALSCNSYEENEWNYGKPRWG
jgi:hypothetical protein